MLDRCFKRPHVLRRLRANPARRDLDRMAAYLLERGYAIGTIRHYIEAVEHFGRWIERKGVLPSAIDEQVVTTFLCGHLPRCRCPFPNAQRLVTVRAALGHMLFVKQELNPSRCLPEKLSPVEAILQDFDLHMQSVCGLAKSTRCCRLRIAREFLQGIFRGVPLRFDRLTVKDPIAFIVRYAHRHCPGSVQLAGSSLRRLFRFLEFRGLCTGQLTSAVPPVSNREAAPIPKTLNEEQLKRFLESFDRSTAVGRRGYAMALCMADLGLRAGEVAQLRLADLDWRESTLRVPATKTRRCNFLPLLPRVGQAIVQYLRHGRPGLSRREVFLPHRAPFRTPLPASAVRSAMARAYARTGCDRRWSGTHMLRHTAATRMIQRGATLKEIADILGHRSIDTTTIYAKVNLPMLANVAMPWPEVHP